MKRDDIIRMARQSGLGDTGVLSGFVLFQAGFDELDRFAALVAAAEREECAKVCDREAHLLDGMEMGNERWAAQGCAAAIRARGQA